MTALMQGGRGVGGYGQYVFSFGQLGPDHLLYMTAPVSQGKCLKTGLALSVGCYNCPQRRNDLENPSSLTGSVSFTGALGLGHQELSGYPRLAAGHEAVPEAGPPPRPGRPGQAVRRCRRRRQRLCSCCAAARRSRWVARLW
jgi:hypothetical protein